MKWKEGEGRDGPYMNNAMLDEATQCTQLNYANFLKLQANPT